MKKNLKIFWAACGRKWLKPFGVYADEFIINVFGFTVMFAGVILLSVALVHWHEITAFLGRI